MRKLASQVPDSVSRLLRSTLLRTPPTWYNPVLANPPPVQPSRRSPVRPAGAQDTIMRKIDRSAEGRTRTHQMKHLRERKPRAESVVYEEDRIRRRFFMDFPFEALRPTSLVEGREVRGEEDEGVRGKEWTRLEQRGGYATVENTIAFTLNLHHTFEVPMSEAYETAVNQFSDLRARHELATLAAEAEARAHGAEFRLDPFERVHAKETKALSTLATYTTSTSDVTPSSKYKKPTRWSMTVPSANLPSSEFTGGQGYAKKWRLPPPVDMGMTEPLVVGSAATAGGASSSASTEDRRSEEDEERFHPRRAMEDEEFITEILERPIQTRA